MTDIKDRIFILRTENSLTQEQMAKIFKVGISTISMWEKGERIPRPKLLQELCDYFKIGYCNSKQFVNRLNSFGITEEELILAVENILGKEV